jgi:hypothetical protein
MGRTATKTQMKADWRRSLRRMEQQGNAEGARYFRALIGGWSEYEAQRIAKGQTVNAITY